MKIAMLRGLQFALAAFVLLILWQVLTTELPRTPISESWKRSVLAESMFVALTSASMFVGGAIGFRLLPQSRVLSRLRVIVIGVVFALLAEELLYFALQAGGLVIGIVAAVIGSALAVLGGGYVLSRNAG